MFRILLVLGWAGIIFLFTCTISLEQLLETMQPQFSWQSNPNLAELLAPLPKELPLSFLLRKAGHAFVFFIFSICLFLAGRSLTVSVMVSVSYALATEVLQLFFTRDGRLFDVAFDSIGITAALLVIGIAKWLSFLNKDIRRGYKSQGGSQPKRFGG